jgi:hypothetical protein
MEHLVENKSGNEADHKVAHEEHTQHRFPGIFNIEDGDDKMTERFGLVPVADLTERRPDMGEKRECDNHKRHGL